MNAFVELLEPYTRHWPYAVAMLAGGALMLIDRRLFGHYVFAALLVLVAIGGAIGMYASPFTFSGDGYYFQSLIAQLFALAALAGYALAAAASWTCGRMCRGRTA